MAALNSVIRVSEPPGPDRFNALLGRRQANICFHFAGSGENLPDIAKSCGASMDNKEFSSLVQILIKQNSFLF